MAYGRVNVGGTIPKVLKGRYNISNYGSDVKEFTVFDTSKITSNWNCLIFDINELGMYDTSYIGNIKSYTMYLGTEILATNDSTRVPEIWLKTLTLYRLNENNIYYIACLEKKANDEIYEHYVKSGVISEHDVLLTMKQTTVSSYTFKYKCYANVYFQK